MALIQPSSLVSDISGSVGGTTFQRSRTGLIARNKPFPVNRSSAAQSQSRVLTFQLTQAWSALTDAQRSAWNTFASYQNLQSGKFSTALYTGQWAFLQINRYRVMLGLAMVTDPVFSAYSLTNTLAEVRIVTGQFLAVVANCSSSFDSWPVLLMSAHMQSGRVSKPSRLRFILPTRVASTAWRLNESYISAFGTLPVVGDRIYVSCFFLQLSNNTLSAVSSQPYTIQA